MSGMDDFFDEEGPPTGVATPTDQRATRSVADDLLDAVEGISRRKRVTACLACGSENIVTRGNSLMGGTKVKKCRDCGAESPMATVQSAVVKTGPVRAQSGPFYGSPRPTPTKNQPAHRVALEAHEAKKR